MSAETSTEPRQTSAAAERPTRTAAERPTRTAAERPTRTAAASPTRTAAEREATRRQEILEAARALFVSHGYRRTTMEDIARGAGITKPTIYSYFEGKKDIMVSLVEWEAERVLEAGLSQLRPGAGAPEQLATMFGAAEEYLEGNSFLERISTRDPDMMTPEVINVGVAYESRMIELLAGILARGMEEGSIRRTDPRLLAYAVVRLHETFNFTSFFEDDGYTRADMSKFLVETVLAAVRPGCCR